VIEDQTQKNDNGRLRPERTWHDDQIDDDGRCAALQDLREAWVTAPD
jgi:hypothetical protein